jgi:hypothetical protein
MSAENPPVFPMSDYKTPDLINRDGNEISLRDYFATAALQSIAGLTIETAARNRTHADHAKVALAEACYGIADAMIAARAK